MSSTFTQMMGDYGKEAGSQFGKGVRQAAGWQSRDEVLQEIHEQGDYTTPEGLKAVLEKTRKVDYKAYSEMVAAINEAETARLTADAYSQSIALQKQKLNLEATSIKNKPHILTKYKSEKEAGVIQAYLTANLPEATAAEVLKVKTNIQAIALISKYVEDSDMKKEYKTDLKAFLKQQFEAYKAVNLNNPDYLKAKDSSGGVSKASLTAELGDTSSAELKAVKEKPAAYDGDIRTRGVTTPATQVQVGTKLVKGGEKAVYETVPATRGKPVVSATKEPYTSIFTKRQTN